MCNITPLSIEELHQKELELLEAFDAFCSEHGLDTRLRPALCLALFATRDSSPGMTISTSVCRAPITIVLQRLLVSCRLDSGSLAPRTARLFTPGASSALKVLELRSLPMKE